MTVEVSFTGWFGNNLFQYIAGRLFAKDNNLAFSAPPLPWPSDLFNITPPKVLPDVDKPVFQLEEGHELFGENWPRGRYRMSGYFQQGRWYLPRKAEIVAMMGPKEVTPMPDGDLAIHLRLTDYMKWKIAIHPRWYRDILDKESFDRLHIFTNERDLSYLEWFQSYPNVTIHHNDPWTDWNDLRRFKRIVMASSTYSWWAVFFSNAQKVYIHKRWVKGLDGVHLTDIPNGIKVDGPFVDEVV